MDEEIEEITIEEDVVNINKSFMPELLPYQYVTAGICILSVIIFTIFFYNRLNATANWFFCVLLVLVPGYISFYRYRKIDFITVSRKKHINKVYLYNSDIPESSIKNKKRKKEAQHG